MKYIIFVLIFSEVMMEEQNNTELKSSESIKGFGTHNFGFGGTKEDNNSEALNQNKQSLVSEETILGKVFEMKHLHQEKDSTNEELNIEEEEENPNIGRIEVPMLIVELIMSILDVLSDFWSGFSLMKLRSRVWGIGSFVINWIPGFIAVFQIIANHRCNKFHWIVLYCLLSVILCPLIPTLSYGYLLYLTPRNSSEERSKHHIKRYFKLLSFVTLVRALDGCVEAPLQLLYKFFLMFNGIVNFNLTHTSFTLEDMHGNDIPVPMVFNLLIKGVCLVKSVCLLNLPFFNSKLDSAVFKFLANLDFTCFLIATTLFKIFSLVLLWGYINFYVAICRPRKN